MAEFKGSNFQKQFLDIPSDVASIGEYGGRIKVMFDSWSETGTLLNDTIKMAKIPSGARILRQGGNAADTAQKIDAAGATSPLANGEKLDGEHVIEVVLAGPNDAGYYFVEYLLD